MHESEPAGAGWLPQDVDLSTPNVARVYDYYLGGAHNFAPDRAFARRAIDQFPLIPTVAKYNREFLMRAVRFALSQGVRQFLDIGAGIPTAGAVHEVAHAVDPSARVVYVDNEPVAITHSQRLLEGTDNAVMVPGDIRQPQAILQHPDTQAMLDFTRPVCLLVVALLHFLPDADRPGALLGELLEPLPAGSLLVASHVSTDGLHRADAEDARVAELTEQFCASYDDTSAGVFLTRSTEEFTALFRGTELLDPGVAHTSTWGLSPSDVAPERPAQSIGLAAVGRTR